LEYADNRYHVEMEKPKNIPSYGRVKEIAAERFAVFAISEKPLTLPRWIRLGKWMSKAEVEIVETQEVNAQPMNKNSPIPSILWM